METGSGLAMKSRWQRTVALAAALVVLASACGGASDAIREAASEAAEDFATGSQPSGDSGDGSAGTGDGADGSGTAANGDQADGAGPSAGPVPTGPVELGESYTFTFDDDSFNVPVTIPAGSVITVEVTADPEGVAGAVVFDANGLFGVSAPPGETVTNEEPILTPREEEIQTQVTVMGRTGETASFAITATPQTDDPDGGDAPETITDAVALSDSRSGQLGGLDRVDYYVLDATAGDVIDWSVTQGADAQARLDVVLEFNGDRKALATVNPGATVEERHLVSAEQEGLWYLRIAGSGSYTATAATSPQGDGGSDGDAGADLASALAIEAGTFTGMLGDDDDADVYRFPIDDSAVITYTVRSDPASDGDVNARLFVNGAEVERVGVGAGGTSDTAVVSFTAGNPGEAFLDLRGNQAAYEVELQTSVQQDGGTPGDAGDEVGTAKTIDATTFSGSFAYDDFGDALAIAATGDGAFEVSVTNDATSEARFSVTVFVDGEQLEREGADPGASAVIAGEVTEGAIVTVVLVGNGASYDVVLSGPAFAG